MLFALFLCALWGGQVPSLKLTLRGMPPLGIAAWRFLIGLACIWLWCRFRGIPRNLSLSEHRSVFLLALTFVAQIATINLGTDLTTSGYALVFLNTSPVFTALLAHHLVPGDRLDSRKVFGLILAFTGITFIFIRTPPHGSFLLGNLFSLSSGILLALIYIQSKFLLKKLSPFQVLFWQMCYGVPLFFLLSFLWERGTPYHLTRTVITSLLYQGIIVAAFCFVAWNHLLQRHSPSQLTSLQFSIPVFGLILSWLILGESITLRFALGVLLIIVGIYLVTSKSPEAVTPEL